MRNFSNAKRIVIKIGTNTLSKNGGINSAYMRNVALQIKSLLDSGKKVVIVTSGSIGMGAGQLGLFGKVKEVKMRQACAGIGQPLLMHEYHKAFSKQGIIVGQVLLTAEILDNRKTYLNLRNCMETLLDLGVVPILNENDCVATDEIGTAFGDNDTLSALVASKIDADVLIMLSDIDALYDKDPRKFPDAKPIRTVYEITKEIEQNAGEKGSSHAVGGMKTKLRAANIASNAGFRILLVDGKAKNIIRRVIDGEEVGTVFMPKRKLSNRSRWILNSQTAGTINIDKGAMQAITNHKSLLPSGIISVDGTFEANCVVMINDMAKAVTNFDSAQLQELAGKHSTEIRKILGPNHRDVVATPEDIVFLNF